MHALSEHDHQKIDKSAKFYHFLHELGLHVLQFVVRKLTKVADGILSCMLYTLGQSLAYFVIDIVRIIV